MRNLGRTEAHQPRVRHVTAQTSAQTANTQTQTDVFSEILVRLDELEKTIDLLVDGVQKMLEKLIELQGQMKMLLPRQQEQQHQQPQQAQQQQTQQQQQQPDRDLSPEDVEKIVAMMKKQRSSNSYRGGYRRYGGYYRGRGYYGRRRYWR